MTLRGSIAWCEFLAPRDWTFMVLPFWLAAIVVGINLLLLPYLGLILVTALAALYSRRVAQAGRSEDAISGRDSGT